MKNKNIGFPGGLGPKPEDGPITWRGKTVIMDERDDVTAEAMAELRVKRNLPEKIICIGLPSKDNLIKELFDKTKALGVMIDKDKLEELVTEWKDSCPPVAHFLK